MTRGILFHRETALAKVAPMRFPETASVVAVGKLGRKKLQQAALDRIPVSARRTPCDAFFDLAAARQLEWLPFEGATTNGAAQAIQDSFAHVNSVGGETIFGSNRLPTR